MGHTSVRPSHLAPWVFSYVYTKQEEKMDREFAGQEEDVQIIMGDWVVGGWMDGGWMNGGRVGGWGGVGYGEVGGWR